MKTYKPNGCKLMDQAEETFRALLSADQIFLLGLLVMVYISQQILEQAGLRSIMDCLLLLSLLLSLSAEQISLQVLMVMVVVYFFQQIMEQPGLQLIMD